MVTLPTSHIMGLKASDLKGPKTGSPCLRLLVWLLTSLAGFLPLAGCLFYTDPCYGYASSPIPSKKEKNITPIISKIDSHIKDLLNRKQIPGCAIAIVYRNQIIFMNTYGVKAVGKDEKINMNTVFQLGSLSKPIAATLTSVLENKGRLRLDDPIKRHLPNFSLNSKEPSWAVKIRHILSHSTGVPRGGFNNLIECYFTYDHLVKIIQKKKVRTPVGKKYDYNNAMFGLISDVTKAATKLSFKDALHINLLQPLNMTKTSATFEGLISNKNRAMPHVKRRGRFVPCPTYSTGYYTVAPAGGMNSSIMDMGIFLNAQMGAYPNVLNHKVLARIHTPQVPTQNILNGFDGSRGIIKNPQYGLGWRIADFANQKLIFHGGWLRGFTNFIAFMPEQKVGIVVLHNGDSKFSSKIALKFFELYFDIPEKVVTKLKGIKKRKKKRSKNLAELGVFPTPLSRFAGEGARRSFSEGRRVRVVAQSRPPSSGAARHLLPKREKVKPTNI